MTSRDENSDGASSGVRESRFDGPWAGDLVFARCETWKGSGEEVPPGMIDVAVVGVPFDLAVTNRPGVLADIALALGRAGIGISDLTLSPSSDNTAGVVGLWVDTGEAGRAAALRTPASAW